MRIYVRRLYMYGEAYMSMYCGAADFANKPLFEMAIMPGLRGPSVSGGGAQGEQAPPLGGSDDVRRGRDLGPRNGPRCQSQYLIDYLDGKFFNQFLLFMPQTYTAFRYSS